MFAILAMRFVMMNNMNSHHPIFSTIMSKDADRIKGYLEDRRLAEFATEVKDAMAKLLLDQEGNNIAKQQSKPASK